MTTYKPTPAMVRGLLALREANEHLLPWDQFSVTLRIKQRAVPRMRRSMKDAGFVIYGLRKTDLVIIATPKGLEAIDHIIGGTP